jgi:rubrerythrin
MEITSEVLKALETAIQIEKDGLAFYTEAAKQTEDPKGKRMFQTLAKDEAAHQKLFETARESLLKEGGWLQVEQIEEISPSRSVYAPVFPTGDEINEVEIPERQLDALRRGIEAERASIEFYSEQRDKVEDPDAKAMYAYLIEQEEGHRIILQGEYDYLTNTGFWFDVREFDLEAAS